MLRAFKRQGNRHLVILPFSLSIFGLIMIFDSSSVVALKDFGDKFYYFKHQLVWFLLGTGLFFLFSLIDYHFLKKLSLPFFLLNLFFLVVVIDPRFGKQVYGGRRWLELGNFGFQPGEFIKLSLAIYLATLFEKKRNFLVFLLIIGLIFGLLILEPDLSTASIVSGMSLAIYFAGGYPLKQVISFFFITLISGSLLIVNSSYRKKRLLTFLDSSFDSQGASYHLKQILIALGSGGIFGKGFGQGRQKFLFLPEATTDSIFAVIAEEFGFFGSIILIIVFISLIFQGIKVALSAKDKFGQMLCLGIVFYLGLQTIINFGSMVALLPLTGVPLPFISYGGSSLITNLIATGIVYNISKNRC